MAESSAEAGAPNLNLNAEEKRVYGQLFRQADTDNVGVVTGEVAVKFFEKTRLDSRILGEIWQIADKENRGFLTPAGFGIVLRLIGHAQAGREPSPELALQQGPIPRFDGIVIAPAPTPTPASPAALLPQGTGPIRIPSLTPDKVAQYTGLFERQPLQGSMLPGDQAKQIFEKSGLPNETLGRIWMLADTEQRGALVSTEFVIAMHLLTCMKSGALRALPNILPAALYEAATRRGPVAATQRQSPTISTAMPAIQRQLSGQAGLAQMRTGSPLAGSPLGRPPVTAVPSAPAAAAAASAGDWLITPAEKGRYDMLYSELDKSNKGFITGEEAVTFFGQSKLPGEILASIWDLADINSEGRLNRDEFAVAMYLIRQQRTKQDGSMPLPSSLPANLIPPSMRNQVRAVSGSFEPGPTPTPAPAQARPSALDDLFGLDDSHPPMMPAAQPLVAMGTGGSGATDPFASGLSPPAPSSPIRPSPTGTSFKPFVPSSTFGRGLTAQATGGSTGSAPPSIRHVPLPPVEDDLLGDSEGSNKAVGGAATVELANLSNQIGSLTKQVQDIHVQRTTAQNDLSQAAAQKTNFEQRLAQLRAMYDKEAKDVQSLQAKLAESKNATSKLQKEMAMINATYQDLQSQRQQALAALQADQQENASLKERISAVNAEVAQLKPQLEKVRSEARQQKGLVAINKKQLATLEGERDKTKSEVDDVVKSNAELARQANSGSPSSGRVASPALSTASGNNPFFKRTGSVDKTSTFSAAPPVRSFSDRSFDDVFGPTFPTSGSGAATMPAPNKPQLTGSSTASATSFGTPATPNLSRIDVPPPPESRQLSSTHLPFVDAPESLSSSRHVSPPMSRLDTPAVEPNAMPPFGPASLGSGVNNAKQAAASPGESQPTSTGASALFDSKSKDETATSVSTDTLRAANEAKAREDFEAAFASFKTAKTGDKTSASANPTKSLSDFDSEFPPISELERDESDSEDDRDGFDDDFAPVSPPPTKVAGLPTGGPPPGSPPKTGAPGETSTATQQAAASETPTSPMGRVNDVAGTQAENMFGSAAAPSSTMAPSLSASNAQAQAPPIPAKAAFDDLDDDFEGLEDAKEGSADDDFANISRSGLDDFNGTFEGSPSRTHLRTEASNATSMAPFGTDSSFDFASLSTASAAGSATAVAPAAAAAAATTTTTTTTSAGSMTTAKAPDSHDWDAIFSSLDDAPAAKTVTGAASPGNATSTEPSRPAKPGRALTEAGEHDDPILKNLTGMGYSRADALSALEKYDYNLERAANFLASQS